jgi:polyhydroxybutyrate depolymerase
MRQALALLLASALIVSCGGDGKSTDSAATVAETTGPPTTEAPIATLPADQVAQLVGERPYNIFVPSSYDAAAAMPLVLALHGFRGAAVFAEDYFQFQPLAEEYGFVYVLPEGSKNEMGDQFWNATDACCGGNSTVDDSTYLRAVIDDVKAKLTIDPKRVYIVGHSNGGFMAHRMACDHADAIAAIISVAGATSINPDACVPSEPVSILQVHGTQDTIIFFDGGIFMQPFPYPSATQTVETWSGYDECAGSTDTVPFDLDPTFAGDEVSILAFGQCARDTTVELWKMDGVGHTPVPTTAMSRLIDFLFAHPKA